MMMTTYWRAFSTTSLRPHHCLMIGTGRKISKRKSHRTETIKITTGWNHTRRSLRPIWPPWVHATGTSCLESFNLESPHEQNHLFGILKKGKNKLWDLFLFVYNILKLFSFRFSLDFMLKKKKKKDLKEMSSSFWKK